MWERVQVPQNLNDNPMSPVFSNTDHGDSPLRRIKPFTSDVEPSEFNARDADPGSNLNQKLSQEANTITPSSTITSSDSQNQEMSQTVDEKQTETERSLYYQFQKEFVAVKDRAVLELEKTWIEVKSEYRNRKPKYKWFAEKLMQNQEMRKYCQSLRKTLDWKNDGAAPSYIKSAKKRQAETEPESDDDSKRT